MVRKKTAATKSLGVFSLAMITAGSVDSIRNLPTTALFGSTLIFFFLLGALFFLLPSALVAAELASTSPEEGGIYSWVKQAFGKPSGFMAVWFQWIENVIWYPTILSFVAGAVAYLINPELARSKLFLIAIILIAFWGATIVNLLGIKSSAFFGNFCAIVGLLIPMALIIGLGVFWIGLGKPLQIRLNFDSLFPNLHNTSLWVALTGIMMSFCGMEVATVHGSDVKNPQRAYPRAMLITTLIILSTLICGSLAIAIVLPQSQISLVAGLMQAFHAFFAVYHMDWILPFVAMMLIIGGMGGVSNWIIAPTRGLMLALNDSRIFPRLTEKNKHDAPRVLLLSQAVIVTFITLLFLWMPTVNASYWLLTALAAQLYMIMYIIMFIAAIRLRFLPIQRRPGFLIPGGKKVIGLVSGIGLIGCLVTFFIGFIPPNNISVGGFFRYEFILLSGLVILTTLPLFFYFRGLKYAKQ